MWTDGEVVNVHFRKVEVLNTNIDGQCGVLWLEKFVDVDFFFAIMKISMHM